MRIFLFKLMVVMVNGLITLHVLLLVMVENNLELVHVLIQLLGMGVNLVLGQILIQKVAIFIYAQVLFYNLCYC